MKAALLTVYFLILSEAEPVLKSWHHSARSVHNLLDRKVTSLYFHRRAREYGVFESLPRLLAPLLATTFVLTGAFFSAFSAFFLPCPLVFVVLVTIVASRGRTTKGLVVPRTAPADSVCQLSQRQPLDFSLRRQYTHWGIPASFPDVAQKIVTTPTVLVGQTLNRYGFLPRIFLCWCGSNLQFICFWAKSPLPD